MFVIFFSLLQASKAALTSFYETLRVELGREVGVTIATPGLMESEMTQGKMLTKKVHLQMDQETTDSGGTVPCGVRRGIRESSGGGGMPGEEVSDGAGVVPGGAPLPDGRPGGGRLVFPLALYGQPGRREGAPQ